MIRTSRVNCLKALITMSLAFILLPWKLVANPIDGAVVSGKASIQQIESTMTIRQSTTNLILNWRQFDVNLNSEVRFIQPSAQAVALNRVTGHDPSVILGKIEANGNIFLLNPNGIIFSRTAQVNVGGILATTLSITNHDFLNHRDRFVQDAAYPTAAVVNHGDIEARSISLAAPQVVNDGTLQASLGKTSLANTTVFTASLDRRGLINIAVPRHHSTTGAAISAADLDSLLARLTSSEKVPSSPAASATPAVLAPAYSAPVSAAQIAFPVHFAPVNAYGFSAPPILFSIPAGSTPPRFSFNPPNIDSWGPNQVAPKISPMTFFGEMPLRLQWQMENTMFRFFLQNFSNRLTDFGGSQENAVSWWSSVSPESGTWTIGVIQNFSQSENEPNKLLSTKKI